MEKLDLESDNRNPGSFCCDFSAISNGHAWEVPKIRRYLNRKDLMDRGNMLGWKPPEITVDFSSVQPQWSEVPYVNTTKLPWRKIFGDFYSMIASDSAASWQNAATVLPTKMGLPDGYPRFQFNGSSFSPDPDWHPRPQGPLSATKPRLSPHLFEQSSIYGQRVEQQHLTIPHLEAEKVPSFSMFQIGSCHHVQKHQLHGRSHKSHPPESPGRTHQPIRLIIWAGLGVGFRVSVDGYHVVLPKSTKGCGTIKTSGDPIFIHTE